MKFLILNVYNTPFVDDLYRRSPGLEERPYLEQLQMHTSKGFHTGDFYSMNLKRLGHEAEDVVINSFTLQQQWATENNFIGHTLVPAVPAHLAVTPLLTAVARRLLPGRVRRALRNMVKVGPASRDKSLDERRYQIVAAQVKSARPDVVINAAMPFTSDALMSQIKRHTRLLIGQTGWPVSKGETHKCYDLILSSLPNFVEELRQQGLPSELFKLGFESSILSRLKTSQKVTAAAFIGALSWAHRERVELLEYLCQRVPMTVWGHSQAGVAPAPESAIGKCWKGLSWGLENYQILADAKIALNVHADFAKDFANNIRLYETTGVGTMLLTDSKKNLADMFEPGKEVVVYRSREECAELIEYYLTHDEERESIASAGQRRTLASHTYYQRMQELLAIVRKHL
jgi:spore maturation protein CgeB